MKTCRYSNMKRGIHLFCFMLCNLTCIAQTSLQLSKALYTLNDTMDVTVQGHKDLSEAYTIDLVSPFGEVVAQKRTSESTVSFPIMPMWESGFYELRMYKDISSPITTTNIVPILKAPQCDSIPIWQVAPSDEIIQPEWYRYFISTNPQHLKGLLINKKGKAIKKAGVTISVYAYDEDGNLVWNGLCLSGSQGEFSVAVPQSQSLSFVISALNRKGKDLGYGAIILSQVKQGCLSADYATSIDSIAKNLGLIPCHLTEAERNYYYFNMHHEAINAYFSGERIPGLGDWFVSHPSFSNAMRHEHRAVGWNGKSFSMLPPKKIEVKAFNYRMHDLYGEEGSFTYYTGGSLFRNVFLQSYYVVQETSPLYMKREGAPRILISQISSLVVLTGHDNAALVPEDRAYLRPYDPIMVYFK